MPYPSNSILCPKRIGMAYMMILALLLCLFAATSTHAAAIDEQNFSSEEQRALYYKLSQELRCPKCQNQNIGDSNSQIAIDLRNQVARLVKEDQSEEEIKTYMVNRYGDFVLYEPPLQKDTLFLWFGPLIMFALGIAVFVISIIQRRKNAEQTQVNDDVLEQEVN